MSSSSDKKNTMSLSKKRYDQKESDSDAINNFISLAKDRELKREDDMIKKKEQKAEKKRRVNENEEKADLDDYPYTVNDDDHCETPVEAYSDISTFLSRISVMVKKTNETLQIFDPYHCEGSVISRLGSIGFKTVHNEKVDFYASILNDEIPDYDVLVTNPPYSSDHMKKLLKFCAESKKPWFLLLPNYVYLKDYYVPSLQDQKPFYVAPKKRYMYTTPKVSIFVRKLRFIPFQRQLHLFVCIYICMYIHMYIYTYVYIYVYVHICI
jgi:hypothetical protein